MVIVSYRIHPYRPHFSFNSDRAVDILRYGVWLLGSGVAGYLSLQADNIVAGRIVGTAALGVYQMAYVVSNLPTTEIAKQVGKVVQSGFAELQSNPNRMDRMLQKVVLTVFAIVLPIALGIALTAPTLVPVVLGEKWNEVVPILPVLAFGGVFRALSSVIGSFFKATGDTHFLFQMSWMRAIVLCVGLLVSILFSKGLYFIACAFSFSVFAKTVLAFFFAFNNYLRSLDLLVNTIPTLLSSIFMCIFVYLISLISTNIYLSMAGMSLVGFISYLFIHYLLEDMFSFRAIKYSTSRVKSSIYKSYI